MSMSFENWAKTAERTSAYACAENEILVDQLKEFHAEFHAYADDQINEINEINKKRNRGD